MFDKRILLGYTDYKSRKEGNGMAQLRFSKPLERLELLRHMREDAQYDAASASDPVAACPPGFRSGGSRAKAPLPKVPKVFLSNCCAFNCSYCGCRASNGDKIRYCNQPREMARIAVDEAVRNRHGVFLTSAVYKNADYTEELIVETLRYMREELHYPGYIHAKVMPGTDPFLIEKAGRYANRLSVNIEVAKSEGYARIAKQKNRDNILSPMATISRLIQSTKQEKSRFKPSFATSQTTQLMAGSTGEDDRTILTLSHALYQKYHLGRVYYTAFQYRHPAAGYNLPLVSTPIWRVGRLYQADRLLQLYGFTPDEILPPEHSNLSLDLDPKTDWALRNPHFFPVEINRAPYETLVRVPGIGDVYAKRILQARRLGSLDRNALLRLGIPIRKCLYFITCAGLYEGGRMLDRPDILRTRLAGASAPVYEQLCFEDCMPNSAV